MQANDNRQNEQTRAFYLAHWYVEPASDRISDCGAERKLESKVMAVLAFLASRPGEVVTREELERAIWGNTVVSYDALTANIAKLRKALNDSSRQPRFIDTVAKKGYRLIAPVNPANGAALGQTIIAPGQMPSPRAKISPRMVGIVLCAVLVVGLLMAYTPLEQVPQNSVGIDMPSIAVLPFKDLSSVGAETPLGDGITEDITSAIARLSGVMVVARSSAERYRDNPDSKRIAQALGVRHSDTRLRINVQLIDGHSGFQLWAKHYDDAYGNVFSMQDSITREIVQHLAVKITAQETTRIAQRYTTSIEAYNSFLQGQTFFSHHSEEGNAQARALFQKAIELDPAFARAYGALALTFLDDYRYHWRDGTALTQAMQLANQALNIDAQLPQAHWVLANVYLFGKQHHKAITAAKRAIELEPNYADAYATLAVSNLYSGDPQTAVRMISRAMRLNPDSPARYRSALGQAYYYMNDYSAAESVLTNSIQRNGNLIPARLFLIATLGKLGKWEEAHWEAEQLQIAQITLDRKTLEEMFPLRDEQMLQELLVGLKTAL